MMSWLLYNFYKAKIKLIKFRRMLIIPLGQKVLDIGGGDGPFPRADIVCEKFISDDSERTNPFFARQPLVVGDIENLPFTDNSFDFVFCSHILEHATNPEKAIREITRIGKRGYIEVPSEYHERTAKDSPAHIWLIKKAEDGTLVFKKKMAGEIAPLVGEIYKSVLFEKDKTYMAFHWKNYYRLFHLGMYWEKSIPIHVEKSDLKFDGDGFIKGKVDSIEQIEKVLANLSISRRIGWSPKSIIKKLIRKIFTDSNTYFWLDSHLACPVCKTTLIKEGQNNLACRNCRGFYPLIGKVPLLLSEYFQKSPYKSFLAG